MHRYYAVYKPFQVLSQFTSEAGKKTLSDCFDVAKDVYPVGRLDYDSEGLLILTNDTQINHRLLNPLYKHEREYWAQVEGVITTPALRQLIAGPIISVDGRPYKTQPCKAEIFEQDPLVAERNPPIRFRKNIPASWIKLILTEGKNRQVRKMTAAIGFPTLRLIRTGIEKLRITNMQPGDINELTKEKIYSLLFNK